MTQRPDPRFGLDRRTFLLGAAAAGVVAACGGDSAGSDPFSVVQRYPSDVLVPGEIRLPFSIAREAEFITDGPDELNGQVVDLDGSSVGGTITAVRRDISPAPYYAFRTTIETPGVYGLQIDGGPDEGANFQVFERGQVAIPVPGDTLAGFDTPTDDSPRGVDPICTRDPICDFHAMTLTDALLTGPVAYFVGTPAFCQTGTCAPALETLIGVSPEYGDVSFVHAEVWSDTTAQTTAPAVDQLGLTFEPTLFLTDASGVIVERIDGLWDATELRERLDVLTG
jgi:hypothetical protein